MDSSSPERANGEGVVMSIPDWLIALKDKFTDAASFAFASKQIESLETHIGALDARLRLKDDQIGQLIGKIADLKTQIISLRSDLASKTDEAAELEKQVDEFKAQVDEFKAQEQYDVSSGIAFKRSKQYGGYEETPLCPTCHRPLSQLIKKWGCNPCSYYTSASPHAALSALRDYRQKD